MITRKNQKALSSQEWADLIDAVNQTHGVGAKAPAYRSFVKVHERAMNPTDMQGMSWAVHTMEPMMRGRNFLSWHRQFVRPGVAAPKGPPCGDYSVLGRRDGPQYPQTAGRRRAASELEGQPRLACEFAAPQIRCDSAQRLRHFHGLPGGYRGRGARKRSQRCRR